MSDCSNTFTSLGLLILRRKSFEPVEKLQNRFAPRLRIEVPFIDSCLNIFQDIFLPTWSASLIISDAVNIQTSYDVAIGDDVEIEIETDTPTNGKIKKNFKFVLQSISNKILIRHDLYGYDISLVVKEQLKDIKTRVSKSYKNKQPNEIVSSIISEFIGGSSFKY